MLSINKLFPKLKKQFLKITLSIIVSAIITLIISLMPKKDFAEFNLDFSIKNNFLFLKYYNTFQNNISVSEMLRIRPDELKSIIIQNNKIVTSCKILKVSNGDFIFDAKLEPNSLSLNIITQSSISDKEMQECAFEIEKILNEKVEFWLVNIIRIIKIKSNFFLEGDDVENNFFNKSFTYQLNKQSLQADLSILNDILELDSYFDTYIGDLNFKHQPNYIYYFIIIFIVLIVILNFKLLINFLKKY